MDAPASPPEVGGVRQDRRVPSAIALVAVAAFLLRLVVRLRLGAASFASEGYSFFLSDAREIVRHGLTLGGVDLGGRPPVYPYLLALAGGEHARFLPIVILQGAIGAGTVLCAYLVGRELFSRRVGTIAALVAAIYPYYVVHDSAVQETSTVTFFSTLATFLLLVAARRRSWRLGVLAGLTLAALVLTRLTMLPFAVLAVAWLSTWGTRPARDRARIAIGAAAPFAVAVVGWLLWNQHAVGRATLSDGVASQFWMAHNAATFSAYPDSSIDLSRRRAMAAWTPAQRAEFHAASGDHGTLEHWFADQGWSYVERDPWRAARGALRMLVVGFSWRLSPRAGGVKQLAYTLSYAPIAILGLAGVVLSRRRWRELGVVYANVLGFVIVTMIFWAHTSHRVHLDVFLMIFAAYAAGHAMAMLRERRRPA